MTVPLDTLLRRPEAELFSTDDTIRLFFDPEGRKFDVRRPFAAYPITNDPDWAADPYTDKTWQLYFHSFYWIQAFDTAITRNPDQIETLTSDLKAIILSNVAYILNAQKDAPEMVWDDHATSYRASYMSFIYIKYLKPLLSPAEDADMRAYMMLHRDTLKEYLASDRWLLSNHTLFQLEGLIDLAAVFTSGQEQKELFEFTAKHFSAWFHRIVNTEEGSVKEHATFYHAFLMTRIDDFSQYAAQIMADRLPSMPDISGSFLKMNDFLWNMSVRHRQFPGTGDSKYRMRIDQKHVNRFESETYQTPQSTYLISQGKSGKAKRGLSKYPQDGFYFVRNGKYADELFTSFLDKPFIGPHGHSDGLSFECFYRGMTVLADSGGPFKYGNKLRFKYFQKPIGHNAVVIGDGQQRYSSNVHHVQSSKGITQIKGDARITSGIRWVRGLVQLSNDYLVVADLVDANSLETGAYARFQIAHDFTISTLGDHHFALSGPDNTQVEAKFLRTEFAQVPHPDEVGQAPFVLEHGDEALSLHELALLTDRDNHFIKAEILRSPMAPRSLHVSIFSFGGPIEYSTTSKETAHEIVLKSAKSGRSYAVDLKDRIVDDTLRGFSMNAKEVV